MKTFAFLLCLPSFLLAQTLDKDTIALIEIPFFPSSTPDSVPSRRVLTLEEIARMPPSNNPKYAHTFVPDTIRWESSVGTWVCIGKKCRGEGCIYLSSWSDEHIIFTNPRGQIVESYLSNGFNTPIAPAYYFNLNVFSFNKQPFFPFQCPALLIAQKIRFAEKVK